MTNKYKLNIIIVLLALIIIISCNNKSPDYKYFTIDIADISIQNIKVDDIFSQIEYVFLETLPDCLLNEDHMEVSVTDKYIIANNTFFGGGGAYLFDRKTGEFLYEIGKKG